MSALRKSIEKEADQVQRQVNALFSFYLAKCMSVFKDTRSAALDAVTSSLARLPELDINLYRHLRMDKSLKHTLDVIFEHSAGETVKIWAELRKLVALHGRLLTTFVQRKYSPPWVPSKLDLASAIPDTKFDDTWKSAPYMHMQNLSNEIQRQVTLGLMSQETLSEILGRVRRTMGRASSYTTREERFLEERVKTVKKSYDFESWDQTEEVFGEPPVLVTEGVFTMEDVLKYQDQAYKALKFEKRSVGANKEITKANKMFMAFERDMMADVVEMLHQNMLPGVSDSGYIKDMEWKVSFPQPDCDECTDRSGMTMAEIKAKIKDQFGDSPPPLHFHCKCRLIYKLEDEFKKDAYEKNGYEWNPDKGLEFVPTEKQKALGFERMDWDTFLDQLTEGT